MPRPRFTFKLNAIDRLILGNFLGPFAVTFLLSLFLFLMQFLWKYIDELVGKGIETGVMLQLIFYSLADLVPMALPLTVMVASLMTFGNLSESFELVAMKANGLSLLRILLPVFWVMIALVGLNFLFLNIVIPRANLEAKAMLMDLRKKKPAFNISPGEFYQAIEGYSIRIGKKEEDNETVRDVLIYEFKNDESKRLNVLRAEWGQMKLSPDQSELSFTLYNGVRYDEMTNQKEYRSTFPFNSMHFEKQQMTIDLSSLDVELTDRKAMSRDYRLLNVRQLVADLDTNRMRRADIIQEHEQYMSRYLHIPGLYPMQAFDSSLQRNKPLVPALSDTLILNNYREKDREVIMAAAITHARGIKGTVDGLQTNMEYKVETARPYQIELHKKFSLSLIVLLLFLIAAPLGAIIKKGGIGLPLVISVLLFVLFYAVNLTGEKMGKEGVLPVWLGMWLSSLFLLPIGLFITIQANKDRSWGSIRIPWRKRKSTATV